MKTAIIALFTLFLGSAIAAPVPPVFEVQITKLDSRAEGGRTTLWLADNCTAIANQDFALQFPDSSSAAKQWNKCVDVGLFNHRLFLSGQEINWYALMLQVQP